MLLSYWFFLTVLFMTQYFWDARKTNERILFVYFWVILKVLPEKIYLCWSLIFILKFSLSFVLVLLMVNLTTLSFGKISCKNVSVWRSIVFQIWTFPLFCFVRSSCSNWSVVVERQLFWFIVKSIWFFISVSSWALFYVQSAHSLLSSGSKLQTLGSESMDIRLKTGTNLGIASQVCCVPSHSISLDILQSQAGTPFTEKFRSDFEKKTVICINIYKETPNTLECKRYLNVPTRELTFICRQWAMDPQTFVVLPKLLHKDCGFTASNTNQSKYLDVNNSVKLSSLKKLLCRKSWMWGLFLFCLYYFASWWFSYKSTQCF